MKAFPVKQIRAPDECSFTGRFVCNPSIPLTPRIWFDLGFDIGPIELRQRTPIETRILLGGLAFEERDWRRMTGRFGPFPDVGASSVYVCDRHVPIDVLALELEPPVKNRFRARLDLAIAFETCTDFKDARVSLATTLRFDGLTLATSLLCGSKALPPKAWGLPEHFDVDGVRTLLERFVDTSLYDTEERRPGFFALTPRT